MAGNAWMHAGGPNQPHMRSARTLATMSRENKLALMLGFGLVLFVGILLSDHLSSQQRQVTNDLHSAVNSLQQPLPEASVLVEFYTSDDRVHQDPAPPIHSEAVVATEPEPEVIAATTPPLEAAPEELATPRPSEVAQGTYTVQPGDTLSKIAQRLLGTAKATASLFEMNRSVLPNMDALQIGMQLHYSLPPG